MSEMIITLIVTIVTLNPGKGEGARGGGALDYYYFSFFKGGGRPIITTCLVPRGEGRNEIITGSRQANAGRVRGRGGGNRLLFLFFLWGRGGGR